MHRQKGLVVESLALALEAALRRVRVVPVVLAELAQEALVLVRLPGRELRQLEE